MLPETQRSSYVFQSTFPRGKRLPVRAVNHYLEGFNPRSREGNDGVSAPDIETGRSVSIHVPARETTMYSLDGSGLHGMFQSTFPRGKRRIQ